MLLKAFMHHYRYWIAGSFFVGLAAACFEKHGAIEYAADHIWEAADRAVIREELPKKD
jgi:hypothetical protein